LSDPSGVAVSKAQLIPAIVDLRLVPDESVLNVADTLEARPS
jgi:hypothetical protein